MSNECKEDVMTSASSNKIWRFGAVEFDEAAACIRTEGASVALDRQCVAILSVLIAADGEAVSKDRLLEIGWPGRVVHENSLAKAVGRLRKALGPEGEHLKAIYGAGYCLAVNAEHLPSAPEPSRRLGQQMIPLLAAAAVVGVLGTGFMLTRPSVQPSSDASGLVSSEPADTIGRVLWVDDHPENNRTEKGVFEARDIAVYTVATTDEALTLLSMYPSFDVVISDMGREGDPLAGLKLLKEMRARGNETPFYLYTILTSEEQREVLADHGGQGAAETREDLYGFILPIFQEAAAEQGASAN